MRRSPEEQWALIGEALRRRRDGLPPASKRTVPARTPVTPPRARAARAVRAVRERPGTIFLSGSIGDVLALESFLSDRERETLDTVCYATRKADAVEELLRALPNYPALRHHVWAWSDFSQTWCFYSKNECVGRLRSARRPVPAALAAAADFSIGARFPEVLRGERAYNGSSFLRHPVADVGRFALPARYVAVCPYSCDKRLRDRDFNGQDWDRCLTRLRALGVPGVVLNRGADPVPADASLIDLSNATTIREAIEVLKRAAGYVGIDSALSVLAAKHFKPADLFVKSVNGHCYEHAACYYAPHREFPFLLPSLPDR